MSAIEVRGLRELEADLNQLSHKLRTKVVRDALKLGLKQVQKDAKRRAPKDTGRLRRGIIIKNSRIHNGKRVGLLGRTLGVYLSLRKGKGKADPKDAFYGRFIEDGWTTAGKRTGDRRNITSQFGRRTGRKTQPGKTKVPGKQFIKGAWRNQKGNAIRLSVKAIEKGIDVLKRKSKRLR